MRRREEGQASVELLGMVPWLLIAAVVAWQIMLTAYTALSVGDAARTASRVASLGGDEERAGELALPGILADGATIETEGERVTVEAKVPILVPGLDTDGLSIAKSATFPAGQ